MALSNDQIDALLAATLATYSYSLEKAWALRGSLRDAGLCDASKVKDQDAGEVGNLLKKAGYDRGGITYIIAPRVVTLMEALDAGRLDALAGQLDAGAKSAFRDELERVKGFGPKSSELAWMLSGGA